MQRHALLLENLPKPKKKAAVKIPERENDDCRGEDSDEIRVFSDTYSATFIHLTALENRDENFKISGLGVLILDSE
jgi:hypothetical protein